MASKKIENVSSLIGQIHNVGKAKDLSDFGKVFQTKFLALLIKDRIFSFSIIPIINFEYFTDVHYKKIFLIIKNYTEKYSSTPSIDNISILLKENGENIKLYEKLLEEINEVSLEDRDFIITKARQFCFSKYALLEQEKVTKLLMDGKFEEAKATSIDSFKYDGNQGARIYNLKEDFVKIFDDTVVHKPIPTIYPTFNENMQGGPGSGNLVIMVAPSNFGKCYSKDTPVMMFDCSTKMIQDIVEGDEVMGWDGTKRTVGSTHKGRMKMYKIIQNNGMDYRVNELHDLCLINSKDTVSKDNIFTLTPPEFIAKSKNFKSQVRGFKGIGINFEEKKLPIDPYWLGLWLGDGNKRNNEICGIDIEIEEYLIKYYASLNLEFKKNLDKRTNVSIWKSRWENDFNKEMKNLNLINNKHIPDVFLKNSRENRLKLLAGLIDSDGGLGKTKTSVEITQKNKTLADNIEFLCRSLGLRVSRKEKEGKINNITKGVYHRLIISGKELYNCPTKIFRKQFELLKTKKDELKTIIRVEADGIDNYYGFSIVEDDKMFLLSDFTVVHNTMALVAMARHANLQGKTVFFFSFEIGGLDIIRRHLAGIFKIEQHDLKNNRSLIEMKMGDKTLGNFILIEEKATTARVNTMKTHIEQFKAQGMFPDMICVDSLNQLKLPVGMRYEGDNQKFEYLAEELRDLAKDEDCPLWTVYQTNRSGFEETLNDEKNIGKAIEPLQVADVLITYSQPKAMVPSNKCYAFLVKNRLGKKYIVLECHYDPSMCLFEELAVVDELMLMTDEQRKMAGKNAQSMAARVRDGEFDKKK